MAENLNASENKVGFDPSQMFLEEIQQEDQLRRLEAAKKVLAVAAVIGAERTCSELLPVLNSVVEEDEEEVRLEIAAALGRLGPLIGGHENAYVLIPLLEKLAKEEETVVREKAVESLGFIFKHLSKKSVHDEGLPLLRRLISGEWFSERMSAVGLMPHLYPLVDTNHQSEIKEALFALSKDDYPMVRSAVSKTSSAMIAVLDRECLKREILDVLGRFLTDDCEGARCGVFAAIVAMMTKIDAAAVEQLLVPLAVQCVADKSWRVRQTVAQNFRQFQKNCSKHVVETHVLQFLDQLCRDDEQDIRVMMADQMQTFCVDLEDSARVRIILKNVVPLLKEFSVDTNRVRESLASVLFRLSRQAGKDVTMDHLVPISMVLIKDDSAETRLNLVKNLAQLGKVVGLKNLSTSLIPKVIELHSDAKWHVRLAFVHQLPLLATNLGIEFFKESLNDVCVNLLTDPVFDIRKAMAQTLGNLAEHFGTEWFLAQILPEMNIISKDRNYRRRMSVLHALGHVAMVTKQELSAAQLLPLIIAMSKDKVANIKISVATILKQLTPTFPATVVDSQIKPVLAKLKDDEDPDVRDSAS